MALSTVPRRVLPPGAPAGRYWTHDFPRDIKAGAYVSFTLSGLDKQLIWVEDAGVGLKKKQKKQDKLPRSTLIELEYSTKIKAHRLFVNMDESLVFVFGTIDTPIALFPEILVPRETTLTTYYAAKKRERKILHGYYQGPGHPVVNIHWALAKYSEFFSIDTNSWLVTGLGKVSATVAIRSNARKITEDACYTSSDLLYRDLVINSDGNPELHALWKFLTHLEQILPHNMPGKIGIITDTEYSLLKAINQRKSPIYRDYFLPPAFDLLYATADAGPQEFMPNSLIRQCDRLASDNLKEFLVRNNRVRE
jgi:hypothetical protein